MKILFDKWYWQKRKVRDAVNRWILRRGFAKELPTLEQIADDIGVPAELLSIYIRTRTRKSVLSWRKELRWLLNLSLEERSLEPLWFVNGQSLVFLEQS